MVEQLRLPPGTLGYYRMALAPNSCTLYLTTLQQHSPYGHTRKPAVYGRVTLMGFDYGLITLKVLASGSSFTLVYIGVTHGALQVTCNAGTDGHFLSAPAYLALCHLMHYSQQVDLSAYYWGGFFEPGQKHSKYLDVICDRLGLTITLKPKYLTFWKPGMELPALQAGAVASPRLIAPAPALPVLNDGLAFGYLLADPCYVNGQCIHLPFLMPYLGVLNRAGTAVKAFKRLLGVDDFAGLPLTDEQVDLNAIAFDMATIARQPHLNLKPGAKRRGGGQQPDLNTFELVFNGWHRALSMLHGQPYLRFYLGGHLQPRNAKPKWRDTAACKILLASPKLCFVYRDRGAYHELRLRFKVDGKVFEPYMYAPVYFIRPASAPDNFYLLDGLQDVNLVRFFYGYGFGLSVLKVHGGWFEGFLNGLKKGYAFL